MGIFGWSLPPGCGNLPGEEEGAVEVKIDGVWYAWDESDNLFKHVGEGAERDDGYTFIGKLEWDDNCDSAAAQIRQAVEKLLVPGEVRHG